MRDTIFALSSGAPPAGVAIVRISGSDVRFGLETLIGFVPEPRLARLADIQDSTGLLLDRGLVIFFPGPRSFTGEDVAELHIHGGRASISAVLAALAPLPGFRIAEPGEFTRRAFENGRIDLTAVEGLSDLIRAETEAQRRQALRQADGLLKELYQGWAKRLTHARAMIEAELDFSDEEDIPGSVADKIWPDMQKLALEISAHLSNAKIGEIIRDGFRIALIGPPNAGKSSLLNNLAQRDVAIVSETPGTTRDVVEVRLDIGGYLVLLQDTAGLRISENEIELEGMRRSLAAADTADLVLELCDARSLEEFSTHSRDRRAEKIIVWTKADLLDLSTSPDGGILISNKSGAGIDGLLTEIKRHVASSQSPAGDALPSRARHVQYLKICRNEVLEAVEDDFRPLEVRCESLRNAAVALGRITGTVDVEDLLGVIFSEFCVGK